MNRILTRKPRRGEHDALRKLHAPTSNPARAHFDSLTRDEKATAIRKLAFDGMSDHGISHATGLAVEMVRSILADANPTLTSYPITTSTAAVGKHPPPICEACDE